MGTPYAQLPPHMREMVDRAESDRRYRQLLRNPLQLPDATQKLAARGRVRPRSGMNKGEAAYQRHLQALQGTGEILWHSFEPVKLRLADATFYTPDFAVMTDAGLIEMHDVKGRKVKQLKAGPVESFWAEEDAMVKIKTAAEIYPFRFAIVWPLKGGGWARKDF